MPSTERDLLSALRQEFQSYCEDIENHAEEDSDTPSPDADCESWSFHRDVSAAFSISTDDASNRLLELAKLESPEICRNVRTKLGKLENHEISLSDISHLCLE
jgi:hypothetical protein